MKKDGRFQNFHRVDEELKSQVIYSTEEFWKRRNGVKRFDLNSTSLPAVMIKQACVDIFWPAFKHVCILLCSFNTQYVVRMCLLLHILSFPNLLNMEFRL